MLTRSPCQCDLEAKRHTLYSDEAVERSLSFPKDDEHLKGFEEYIREILLDTHTWLWFYLGYFRLSIALAA